MEPQEKELQKQSLLAAARNLTRFQHEEIRAMRKLESLRAKYSQARARQNDAHAELHSAQEAWYLSNFGSKTLNQELQSVIDQIRSVSNLWTLALDDIMLSCVSGDEEKILQATEQFGRLSTQHSHLWQTRMHLQNAWSLASQANHTAMLLRDAAQVCYDAATAEVDSALSEVQAAEAALPSKGAQSHPLHDAMLREAMAYAGVPEGPRLFLPIYLHKLDVNTVLPGDEPKS